LPLYLNEFAFRFNHRKDPEMFEKMLQSVDREAGEPRRAKMVA
jgi:hypothetical protein